MLILSFFLVRCCLCGFLTVCRIEMVGQLEDLDIHDGEACSIGSRDHTSLPMYSLQTEQRSRATGICCSCIIHRSKQWFTISSRINLASSVAKGVTWKKQH